MKVFYEPNKLSGKIANIALPLVFLMSIVFFIFWGTDESNQTSENPVAKGVAKFYSEVRKATQKGASRLDDYTIELPEPEKSVTDILQQRTEQVEAAPSNWAGARKKRTFKENDTIKTALEQFVRSEGMEIIWDLKYDYIVKNNFSSTSDIKSLVNKVSNVVSSDYSGQVKSFLCTEQRAIIITDKSNNFIENTCVTTLSNSQLLDIEYRTKEYQNEQELRE